MNQKSLIAISGVVVILIGTAVYFTIIKKVATPAVSTPKVVQQSTPTPAPAVQSAPVTATPAQTNDKNVIIPTEFFANISATDRESMNKWNTTPSKDGVSMKEVTKVKAGQDTFFPIIFARYSLDKNGKGKVSAQITLTNPNGKILLEKKYDNIVRSEGSADSGYSMIYEVSGDSFTSKEQPQDYPLGIYKLKAVVTDKVSEKTIEDSFDIEKIK